MGRKKVPQIKPCFLDRRACSSCGGACCKQYPGISLPEDFPDVQSIADALSSGRWCIDYEGDDPFLRCATKGSEGTAVEELYDGHECTFHGARGCELKPDDRPAGCRYMVPMIGSCAVVVKPVHSANAWRSRAGDLFSAKSLVRSSVLALPRVDAGADARVRSLSRSESKEDRDKDREKRGVGGKGKGKGKGTQKSAKTQSKATGAAIEKREANVVFLKPRQE